MAGADPLRGPLVLFDGVCNLCSASVRFLVERDRRGTLRFAAIQSAVGAAAFARAGRPPPEGDPDSLVLVEDGALLEHSTAALRIARHLGGPWRLFAGLLVVPRALRDPVYRFVARNRYRWFGRQETCMVPTPELRARFVRDDELAPAASAPPADQRASVSGAAARAPGAPQHAP